MSLILDWGCLLIKNLGDIQEIERGGRHWVRPAIGYKKTQVSRSSLVGSRISHVAYTNLKSKNEIHMHAQTMKYKWCYFSDFGCNLNALIFVLRLAFHNIQ